MEHLEEVLTIELEPGDVFLDLAGDLIDGHEERQLALPERVDELGLVGGDTEDALAVGDQLHLREVRLHVCSAAEIVPGPSHPLHRHPVVEKTADDSERYQIPTEEELRVLRARRAEKQAEYGAAGTIYHGIDTPSRAILFVVDVSGSMEHEVTERERFAEGGYPSFGRMDIVIVMM